MQPPCAGGYSGIASLAMAENEVIDPVIALHRQFVLSIMQARGWTKTSLAKRAGLARTTITRLFTAEATHALSGRTLSAIADAAAVPIPAGVAATMGGRLDRDVLWRAFQIAMDKVPRNLFGGRHMRTVIDIAAVAYDFLIEAREEGVDITSDAAVARALHYILDAEVARRAQA